MEQQSAAVPPQEGTETQRTAIAIVVAAGAGVRLKGDASGGEAPPKGLRDLAGMPLYLHSLLAFDTSPSILSHVLVVPRGREDSVRVAVSSGRLKKPVEVVAGGARRQDSVLAGLDAASRILGSSANGGVDRRSSMDASRTDPSHLGPDEQAKASVTSRLKPGGESEASARELVAVHDAARPFVDAALIERTIGGAFAAGAAVPAIPASDTVRELSGDGSAPRILDRTRLRLAQTPQVARLDWLLLAYERAASAGSEVTDEAAALEQAGFTFSFVEGSGSNFKITTPEELAAAEAILASRNRPAPAETRIGIGEDRHPRTAERPFVLAGVRLADRDGPAGHSDGDPLCHALVDALLGATSEGSIGDHFPDTDPRWSGASGLDLLERATRVIADKGWRVVNVDAVIVMDSPRLSPHVPDIRRGLAAALRVEEGSVSVKGKRAEGLGFEGSGNGVTCRAIALVMKESRG